MSRPYRTCVTKNNAAGCEPARCFAASIFSTAMTSVFASSVPVTLTFWTANFSGVF